MIPGLDAGAVDRVTVRGAFVPPPAAKPDPAHAAIAAHFDALVALEDACACAAADGDDVAAAQLGAAEHQARRALFEARPGTLQGLADLLAYALAFSLPAWRDSDPRRGTGRAAQDDVEGAGETAWVKASACPNV